MNGYNNSMGEGEITGDSTLHEEWEYPKPDTSAEIVFNKICEEHK